MPPGRAIEILTQLIDEAQVLQDMSWDSPKRDEWTDNARSLLEHAFDSDSSIFKNFGRAQSIVFNRDTTDDEMREKVNFILASTIGVLRNAIKQLTWEMEGIEPPPKPALKDTEKGSTERIGADSHLPGQSNMQSFTLKILQQAIQAVPAVKYALGIAGIISVIAIIQAFRVELRIALFGTILMLVLMTILVLFAGIAARAKTYFVVPAQVFIWFCLIITIATAICLFTAVFFHWPINLPLLPFNAPQQIQGSSPSNIHITEPAGGQVVTREVLIRGKGVPSEGDHLWLFVKSENPGSPWWPQTEVQINDLEWQGCVTLGENNENDVGVKFTIAAVMLTGGEHVLLQRHIADVPADLPEHKKKQEVIVTRGPERKPCYMQTPRGEHLSNALQLGGDTYALSFARYVDLKSTDEERRDEASEFGSLAKQLGLTVHGSQKGNDLVRFYRDQLTNEMDKEAFDLGLNLSRMNTMVMLMAKHSQDNYGTQAAKTYADDVELLASDLTALGLQNLITSIPKYRLGTKRSVNLDTFMTFEAQVKAELRHSR